MRTHTFAIAGCGKLAHIVVDALLKGLLPNFRLIGSYSRSFEKAQDITNKIDASKVGYSCTSCHLILMQNKRFSKKF